jgi:hypothetical protein
MVRTAIAAIAAAAALATTPVDAQQNRVPVGSLECSLSSVISGWQRNMACNFKPKGEAPEPCVGTMTLSVADAAAGGGERILSKIIFGVLAATNRQAGMLTGTYVGATAETSIAAGLGANVLVGGSNSLVALQPVLVALAPVSAQGQIGPNIAAVVQSLELHPWR